MPLGANCHFSYNERNEQKVMAAAITDLDGNIVFSNYQTDRSNSWQISGIQTYETQFWAAGNADIALVAPHENPEKGVASTVPSYPSYPRSEDQICVYLGWIDRPRTITKEDLEENRLLRNFVGVVDNIQYTGSGEGGQTLKIQARDRMKWLLDSEIYYSANENVLGEDNEIKRSRLIYDIANRSIGVFKNDELNCGGCGIEFEWNDEYIVDPEDDEEVPDSDIWYQPGEPLQGRVTNQSLEVSENPEFRIFTSRSIKDKEGKENATQQYMLSEQSPIELIRFLSSQEVFPTDVFSGRDGHIYYVPRNADATAFKSEDSDTPQGDKDRFYRQYFFKTYPSDREVDINQNPINYREERSTIGTRTNILVQNESAMGGAGVGYMYHIKAFPYALDNKDFACKFRVAQDPTIENPGAAAMVGLAAARRLAREARSGMLTLIGDPSIRPGEMVQVFGSPLSPKGGLDKEQNDLSKFFQYKAGLGQNESASGGWDEAIKEYSRIAEGGEFEGEVDLPEGDRKVVFKEHSSDEEQRSYLCDKVSKIEGKGMGDQYSDGEQTTMNTFAKEPDTIFRVEAVIQKFNLGASGFTTEVALISPF